MRVIKWQSHYRVRVVLWEYSVVTLYIDLVGQRRLSAVCDSESGFSRVIETI